MLKVNLNMTCNCKAKERHTYVQKVLVNLMYGYKASERLTFKKMDINLMYRCKARERHTYVQTVVVNLIYGNNARVRNTCRAGHKLDLRL